MAAQIQHGSLEGKAGAGGGLIKQGGQLFVAGCVLIGCRVIVDAVGQIKQRGDFLLGKIQRVDQMSHGYIPPFKAVCVG